MDGNHFFLGEERPLFGKRILALHKTKGNDRKVESTGGPFLLPVFERRWRVLNWKSRYSLFTDVCLLFAQLLLPPRATPRKREKKRSAKRESIYRVSRNVSVNLFFGEQQQHYVQLFFQLQISDWEPEPQTDLWAGAINRERKPYCFASCVPFGVQHRICHSLSAYQHTRNSSSPLVIWKKNGVFVCCLV